MDDIDRANDHIMKEMEHRVAAAMKAQKEGAAECQCGEVVPPARRRLGLSSCIDCATAAEKAGKAFIRR